MMWLPGLINQIGYKISCQLSVSLLLAWSHCSVSYFDLSRCLLEINWWKIFTYLISPPDILVFPDLMIAISTSLRPTDNWMFFAMWPPCKKVIILHIFNYFADASDIFLSELHTLAIFSKISQKRQMHSIMSNSCLLWLKYLLDLF